MILGIESTAHTFGVGIVEESSVLANEREAFTSEGGGMIPYEVAEHHRKNWKTVLTNALHAANASIEDIDGIAYSQGPGIGNCLRIGAVVARSLNLRYKIPLIPVNHCVAHLEIGRLLGKLDDVVLLYASGANTQIIIYEGGRYRVLGETLDMGTGNFLDSLGRKMGLGFPAGPKIEELAKETEEIVHLPYTVKGMNISLGGIYTHISERLQSVDNTVIANSLQETVFAMLVEVSERALALTQASGLVLGGGVACNGRLQSMSKIMAEERGCEWYAPPNEFLVDNGAMIAVAGELLHRHNATVPVEKADVKPKQRTDYVEIPYR